MRFTAVLGLLAVGIYLSFKSVGWAAAFYLWHNVFRPLDFARMEGVLPTAQLVIIILTGSYCINIFLGRLRPRFSIFFWLTSIFLVWIFICGYMTPFMPAPSPATAFKTLSALGGVKIIVEYLGPILLISTCLLTLSDIKLAILTMTLSVAVWGAWLGLGGIRHGVNEYMLIPGGQLSERNYFAAAVACIIPLLLYFSRSYNWKYRKAVRRGLILMAVLCCGVIVFSGSRGAVVALMGMVALFIALISTKKLKHSLILVLLGTAVFFILPDTFFNRMETIDLSTEQTEGSAKERTLLMRSAYFCTLDHPLFGVGPLCWEGISPSYTGLDKLMQPHSMWLLCSAETGLPGLAMLLIILGVTLLRLLFLARRARLAGNTDRSALARALFISISGYSIGLTFLNHYYMELWWGLLAAANCLCSLAKIKKPVHIRDIWWEFVDALNSLFGRRSKA